MSIYRCKMCWPPIRFLRIITRYSVTGEVPERSGHSQSTTVAETYQCQDGYARIFVNQPEHWRRFVEWLGKPAELLDPKLENVQSRFPLRPMIDRLVEARTINYPVKKFFEEFQVQSFGRGADQSAERLRQRRADQTSQLFCTEVDHAELGRHRFPGDPYKFSASPWRIARGAPLLGEHSAQDPDEFIGPSVWRDGVAFSDDRECGACESPSKGFA